VSSRILFSTITFITLTLAAPSLSAQTRRAPAKPSAVKTTSPDVACPSPLGPGVHTGRQFCDVLAGRDPQAGIIVQLPPHTGPATLHFDLHNRHTYSAELERAGRGYMRYIASIGVLTLDNTLISRAAIESEVRRASDLFDRVSGGAGYNGTKAVAPTGVEAIAIEIPAGVDTISILGERLTMNGLDGTATYTSEGRPVAVISDVKVEYRPAASSTRRPTPRKR
jgi:hypothetical protein